MNDVVEPPHVEERAKTSVGRLFPERSGDEGSGPMSEVVAQLQKELVEERDARREERFKWVCSLIFVFDIFTFKEMSTWSAPLMIGILQLLFVVAVGRNWGMDHIWTLTERLAEKWDGKFKGG